MQNRMVTEEDYVAALKQINVLVKARNFLVFQVRRSLPLHLDRSVSI
jgi:hypothetical protein